MAGLGRLLVLLKRASKGNRAAARQLILLGWCPGNPNGSASIDLAIDYATHELASWPEPQNGKHVRPTR